jgi:pSer/pThr/pTyr-binding forkhead associated (FHA) protein
MIIDHNSMHGTRLNEVMITPNKHHRLQEGDIIMFGAEVRRGPETFPACKFRIDFEISEVRFVYRRSSFHIGYANITTVMTM